MLAAGKKPQSVIKYFYRNRFQKEVKIKILFIVTIVTAISSPMHSIDQFIRISLSRLIL
jgi:hypothetical protein